MKDINAIDDNGQTALDIAYNQKNKNENILDLLIKHNAKHSWLFYWSIHKPQILNTSKNILFYGILFFLLFYIKTYKTNISQ